MPFQFQSHPLRAFTIRLHKIVADNLNLPKNDYEQNKIVYTDIDTKESMNLVQYWDKVLKHELPTSDACNPDRMMLVHAAQTTLQGLIQDMQQKFLIRLFYSTPTYSALEELANSDILIIAKNEERRIQELKVREAAATKQIAPAAKPIVPAASLAAVPRTISENKNNNNDDDDNKDLELADNASAMGDVARRPANSQSGTVCGSKATSENIPIPAKVSKEIRAQLDNRFTGPRLVIATHLLRDLTKTAVIANSLIKERYNTLACLILLRPTMTLKRIVEENKDVVKFIIQAGYNPQLVAALKPLLLDESTAVEDCGNGLRHWVNKVNSYRARTGAEPKTVGSYFANQYYSQLFANLLRDYYPELATAIDRHRVEKAVELANAIDKAISPSTNVSAGGHPDSFMPAPRTSSASSSSSFSSSSTSASATQADNVSPAPITDASATSADNVPPAQITEGPRLK